MGRRNKASIFYRFLFLVLLFSTKEGFYEHYRIFIVSLVLAIVVASFVFSVTPTFAASASITTDCQPTVTFFGAVNGTTYTIEVNGVVEFSSNTVSGTQSFTRSSPLTGSATVTAKEGGTTLASVSACSGGGGSAVTFFTPGDKSVSRAAGDRLAIYCNPDGTPQNIDVWGISNAGKGSRLIQLTFADLVAAGQGGLSRDLGANGVLFAGVASDGKTFWFSWQGGPYNATGKVAFAKTVTCNGFKK